MKEISESSNHVLFGSKKLPWSVGEVEGWSVANHPAPVHSGVRAHAWEQFILPLALRRYNLDVFHTPAGQPPIAAKVPTVTTIHDISPLLHPEWFSDTYAMFVRLMTPVAIRRSDRIITVSQSARDDIVSRFPSAAQKTTVIYNGVVPSAEDELKIVREVTESEFLLFVGSNNPRKNLRGLLIAYQEYREHVTDPLPLVVAGSSKNIFAAVDLPAIEGVHALDYVPDNQLAWLYHNAAAFIFPSLYEGFGLPILEAMSAGTPVITSDRGAMAEVAGEAACLIDPEDPEAIAAGIQRVLDNPEYADALRGAGRERAAEFTWERTARQTLEVYREVAEEA